MFKNVPKRLVKELQKVGSLRALARERDINYFYVSQLIQKGIEPTDRTRKGRLARKKLYLPTWSRHQEKPAEPEWLKRTKKAIRMMAKETNDARKKAIYEPML